MELAKTPINVLKSICTRKGWTVDYNMISEEGRVHEPTFTFRVWIDETNLSAIATGLSKKKAKQSAALKALQSLAEDDEEVALELDGLEGINPQEKMAPNPTDKSNPVGKLQEICMRKKWSPPVYLTDEEDGPPHAKVFTMTCRLEKMDIAASGRDKSKKGGKKIAAQEMLNILETQGLYDSKTELEKHSKSNVTSFKGDNNAYERVEGFFKELDDKTQRELDTHLNLPEVEDETQNYAQLLENVARLIGCKVRYTDIPTQFDDKHNILAFMKEEGSDGCDIPVNSAWGSDPDPEKAKQKAARTVLILLDKIRYV